MNSENYINKLNEKIYFVKIVYKGDVKYVQIINLFVDEPKSEPDRLPKYV